MYFLVDKNIPNAFEYTEEPVEESFFGKKEKIIECEKCIDEIISLIKSGNKNINTSKANKKLAKLLTDEFQLLHTIIEWNSTPTELMLGPAISVSPVITVPLISDIMNLGIKMKSKFTDAYTSNIGNIKTLNACIILNSDMITVYKLNAGEILGIILHEIGHLFAYSYINMIVNAQIVIHASTAELFDSAKITAAILSNGVTTLCGIIEDYLIPRFVKQFFVNISKAMSPYLKYFTSLIHLERFRNIKAIIQQGKLVPWLKDVFIGPDSILVGYSKEKFSDSFATAYGYGKELSTALIKLDPENVGRQKNNKNLLILNDLFLATSSVSIGMLNPHPSVQIRVKANLKKLEREYDKCKNPVLKREIKTQLIELEGVYNDYIESQESAKPDVQSSIRKYNEKLFGTGADIRELLDIINIIESA